MVSPGTHPMDIWSMEKENEGPTEFGGGAMWELAQVEVTSTKSERSGDRLCDPPGEQQCETSRAEGCRSVLGDWVVVNKR